MRSLHVILIILASFVIGALAGMHSSRFQVLSVDFTWEPGGHTFNLPEILDPHNSKKPNDIWVKMQK